MLTAESGRWRVLHYGTPIQDALALVYYLSVRNMNAEEKMEFDGHCTCTTEMMQQWEEDKRKQRMSTIMEMGDIATSVKEEGEDGARPE